jgi:hypothetical protein
MDRSAPFNGDARHESKSLSTHIARESRGAERRLPSTVTRATTATRTSQWGRTGPSASGSETGTLRRLPAHGYIHSFMAGVHVLRRCAWRLARIASIPVILSAGGVRLPSPIDPVTRRPMHRAIRPCAIIVRVVPMQMHRQQRSTGDRCPLMEAAILNPLLGVCSSSRGRRRAMLSLLSSPSLLS